MGIPSPQPYSLGLPLISMGKEFFPHPWPILPGVDLGNGYGYQRQRNNAYRPSSFLFNFAVLIYESLETRRVPRDAVSKWSGIELFPPSFSLSICYEVI
jgi:hypothetical protein